jgi:dTDP-4-dehydrorhamnose reductase
MQILVTGAAGMLGIDVQAAAVAAGHQVTAFSRAELDITDFDAVRTTVAAVRPDALINCAAYTKVDGAERDIEGATAANAEGPLVLAEAIAAMAGVSAAGASGARAAGAWLVQVSTDYVFDGNKTTGPYLESDPTGPRSVYGQTKLAGEQAIAEILPGAHTIVRSSWLFGVGGPCFPATMLRLAAERDELRVVADQRGCPTFTPHLARVLVQLAEQRSLPGVVHVAGDGDCSWFEFASEVVAKGAGERSEVVHVSPITTAEYPLPAPRPAFSVLRSERGGPELPHWHQGLSEYLAARALGAAR